MITLCYVKGGVASYMVFVSAIGNTILMSWKKKKLEILRYLEISDIRKVLFIYFSIEQNVCAYVYPVIIIIR